MMIATYLVYLVLSLGITYWVGQTLHRNGRVFLVENFEGQEALRLDQPSAARRLLPRQRRFCLVGPALRHQAHGCRRSLRISEHESRPRGGDIGLHAFY